MKNRTDDLWQQLRRIEQLIESRDIDGALKLLGQVELQVAQAGIESPHLAWLRAIAEDNRSDYEAALTSIQRAIAMDPVAPPFRHSFKVIAAHIREALGEQQGREPLPSTPKLWEVLTRAGEADDGVHLALARHHLAGGVPLEALRVLKAVTTLSPGNIDAWGLLLRVAIKLDDAEVIAEARLKSAVVGASPQTFLVTETADA
ncbi:MAG: hypothetical protein IT380_09935 [Myxococcales bacterium]|nr:hypothetical protein [Myxococcales bacterium]